MPRGDIVLVPYPFSDLSGSKVRPALIISNDRENAILDDVILLLISSNVSRAANNPVQVIIDRTSAEGRLTGLLHTSVVKCHHPITLHRRLLIRTIGQLSHTLMKQVELGLKAAFDIP